MYQVIRARWRVSLGLWLLVFPALAIYLTFTVGPILSGFFYSLTNWNGIDRTVQFVGLANFRAIFHDTHLHQAFRNTLVLAGSITIVQNGIGLLLALALDGTAKIKRFMQTVYFLPAILSPLIVSFIWTYIYSPLSGALNIVLKLVHIHPPLWLGNSHVVLRSIIAVVVWQYMGSSMVIYLAGLATIPSHLYEAGAIDGAGSWSNFWHITLPLLAPAITLNLMLSLIGSMKLFDPIFVLTNGGPGYASETLTTMLYREAFTTNRLGYGTAIAVMLFCLIMVFSIFALRLLQRREVEM